MTRHDEVAVLLGGYTMGSLDGADTRLVDEHLAECADCRAELASLSAVVGLLGRLDASEGTTDALLVREGFADGVVAAVAAERRQERSRARRLQTVLAGAAALAVLVGGIATATGLAREQGQIPPRSPVVEAVGVQTAFGVEATAGVIAHTWGVEITLSATGFEKGRSYAVEVLGNDGSFSTAGAFVGTGDKPMVCNLNSAVLRPDAAGFRVRDSTGRQQVTGTLG